MMQNLNIKECKLLELQIRQPRQLLSILDGIMSKFNIPHGEWIGLQCVIWHFWVILTFIN